MRRVTICEGCGKQFDHAEHGSNKAWALAEACEITHRPLPTDDVCLAYSTEHDVVHKPSAGISRMRLRSEKWTISIGGDAPVEISKAEYDRHARVLAMRSSN